MNTLIGLVLAAVVVLVVAARRALTKKSNSRQKERVRKESAKRELEQDRLDCLDLARGLERPLGAKSGSVPADAAASKDVA